ncbi:MAG: radical SAM protein [Candidatus Sumerlaeia bacterium]
MNVLLLNCPILTGGLYMKELGRCGRKSVAGEIWPQTGLAYLAAMALRGGHDARIIDAMAEALNLTETLDRITAAPPDFIIANVTTPTFLNDARVFAAIRERLPETLLGMAGTHPSALPERTLQECPACDFIIVNEAELTVEAILQATAAVADRNGRLEAMRGLDGLALRRPDGGVQVNPRRKLLADLDALPRPARRLLPYRKYFMPFFEGEPFATVIPTRGCPWKCIFCRAGGVWGADIRVRTPENIMGELEELVHDLGIRHVVFMTDSLTLNRQWAKRFFHCLIEANLGLQWICNSRVDVVDPDMLSLMKRAGCTLVAYGVESGNEQILKRTRKEITLAQAERAIRWTREAGLLSMAYFIIGLPGETHQTIEDSINFAIKIDPDYVNFHVATPFPGTELYEMALQNAWITADNWEEFEEEGSAVMRTEALTPEDLVRAQRRAMQRFYLRPGRIVRELGKIRTMGQLKSRVAAGMNMLKTVAGGAK